MVKFVNISDLGPEHSEHHAGLYFTFYIMISPELIFVCYVFKHAHLRKSFRYFYAKFVIALILLSRESFAMYKCR